MIIHGSRMYGRKNKLLSWGYCEHCDKYVQQVSYKGRKWSHINFIPIYPDGPHTYVIRECKKCGIGLHLPIEKMPEMIEGVLNDAEKSILLLNDGQEYFIVEDENGEEVAQLCSDTLISAAEILHCTGNDGAVEELIRALNKDKLRKVYCAVKGKLLELQGDIDEAIILYEEAVKNYPDDENPYWLLAVALYNAGKLRECREVYENLLKVVDDKTDVMLLLLDVYEGLGEYLIMTETFEQCFEEYPEFVKQKKFVKRYKRACKKAGIKPKEAIISMK